MKKIISFLMIAVLCCSFMINPALAATITTPEGTFTESDFPEAKYSNSIYAFAIISHSGIKEILYVISSEDSSIINNLKGEYKGYSESSKKHSIWISSSDSTKKFTVETYRFLDGSFSYDGSSETNLLTINYYDASYDSYMNGQDGFLYSDIDILNDDGTIFFPAPPVTLEARIMAMVAETMPGTQGTIQQTMMTILLCGVGCLALVISLVLLVKVLRRYLPQ